MRIIKRIISKIREKGKSLKAKRVMVKKAAKQMAESSFADSTSAKMRVEAAKFETGKVTPAARERRREITLPPIYGDNKIVVMVRDPWWLHAYWEITPQRESELKAQMERDGNACEHSMLRVYDITGVKDFNGTNANSYFDIRLKDMAQNWYIEVARPNRDWCVDIGMLAKSGRFYTLARSNYVQTPRFGMSEVMDEEWMCPEEEYWKLFAVSGGFGIGKSSLEMKEIFQKYFKEWVSSGAISSFGSFVMSQRG